jgi:hypothetical protein
MKGLLQRLRGDERGVSAVIVGISLVALFGAAVLAVDSGSLWSARRNLITDTDAAVLAAARYMLANPGAACEAVARGENSAAGNEAKTVLAANDAKSTMKLFQVFPYNGDCASGAGRVRVDGEHKSAPIFAGMFGFKARNVFSSSTSQYGPLSGGNGVRPIAICQQDPHWREWIAAGGNPNNPTYAALNGTDDPATTKFEKPDEGVWDAGVDHPNYASVLRVSAHTVHRVSFKKTSDGACGFDAPGNWGWLDFDPHGGGSSDLRDRLIDGYNRTVSLGTRDPGDENCDPTQPGYDNCGPETGDMASSKAALDKLICTTDTASCLKFPIVIFDTMKPRGGSNTDFHPIAFLGVILRGYNKITGGPNAAKGYFDFEFVDAMFEGDVVGAPVQDATLKGVNLCGGNYGAQIDLNCNV